MIPNPRALPCEVKITTPLCKNTESLSGAKSTRNHDLDPVSQVKKLRPRVVRQFAPAHQGLN